MDNATSGFNATPQGSRLHIAIYGRRNVGKSSLINALAGQQVSIVADVAGTTTDPVQRAIEIHPIGPCLLIDTAGFDDEGVVGILRNQRTRKVLDQTDVALLVLDGEAENIDKEWLQLIRQCDVPVIVVLNKVDLLSQPENVAQRIQQKLSVNPVLVSTATCQGINALRQAIAQTAQSHDDERSITGEHVQPGDSVLLVMPQDRQAPKGRLILPQVQTIRDLLDNGCTITLPCESGRDSYTINR